MEITAIQFPYNTKAISKEAFEQHMILYKGYVSKINAITHDLSSKAAFDNKAAEDSADMYRGLKTGETYSLNGVILHETYFCGMTTEKTTLGVKTANLLEKTYGSFESFLACFKQCAESARGWCVLAYDQRTRQPRIFLQDAHDVGVVTMAFPIIVLDMYEHAYYLDYKTDKKAYIQAFAESINWRAVEKRCEIIAEYSCLS